jgi:phage tail-like protein
MPSDSLEKNRSSYLDYLPAVFYDDRFIGRFLLAFEAILSGVPHAPEGISLPEGFDSILDRIHTYVSPTESPDEFLPWLAAWVALSLRDDWPEPVKRDFIQQIIPLYRQRGTKAGLKTMLQIYLQKQVATQTEYVEIYEFDAIPQYFQVQLRLDSQNLTEFRRKETVARAIIEQEKPAHTVYALQILMPTMRLVSAEKLRAEGVKEKIPLQRLRLFDDFNSTDFETHENKTILGNVVGRSLSEANKTP